MQAHIYPTAPAGMQQPSHESGLAPPAEGGEHVESPGKAKGQLSKVMHKARNLKDKLKKAAGSNITNTHDHEDVNEQKLGQQDRAYPSHANEYGHGDVDGSGIDSYEDEEEEHDQSKYEQIHPIAAMNKNRDGPDLHDASHEKPKPSQSQDMPYTSYNHVPSADISLEQHKPSPSDDVPYKSYDNAPTELSPSQHDLPDTPYAKEAEDSTFGAGALPTSADAKRPDRSYSPVTDMLSQRESTSPHSPTAFGVNVAYPDDIVKPNPEFGHSLSPMHKKIAVINEDLPAETRRDSGLAPAKDFDIQQDQSVPENASINLEEADNSVDLPASEEDWRSSKAGNGSFGPLVTAIGGNEIRGSMKGKDNGMESYLNVSNEDARGQAPFNLNVAGGDASRQGPSDENVLHNDAREHSTNGQNVEPASSEQDSWGKPGNAKHALTSNLIGSDKRPADELPLVDTTSDTEQVSGHVSRAADVQPKSSSAVNAAAATVGAIPNTEDADEINTNHDHENITSSDVNGPLNVDEDEEYYDPNNANDSQFQEGFAEGTDEVEEKALNGALAGSKLQGLGLTDNTHPNTPSAEDVSSPQAESESSESTGILRGLRNTVASTLGYGGLSSPKPPHEQVEDRGHQAIPLKAEQPNTAHSQQQNGGAMQGLKNVLASKLGYGESKEPPNDQTVYDDNGEHANAVKAGHPSNEGISE